MVCIVSMYGVKVKLVWLPIEHGKIIIITHIIQSNWPHLVYNMGHINDIHDALRML